MSTATQRRIIIGDVHGHYTGLMTLLEAISPGNDDQVYFLGDLIDRGPQSAEVVDFVKENAYPSLMGNHEQLLIDSFTQDQINPRCLQAWLYSGGHSTLESYEGKIERLLDHVHWMHTLPLYMDLNDLWLVHAGVNPDLPVEGQTSRELCWIRELFHSSPDPYFTDKLIVVGHTITFTLPGLEPGALAQGPGWLDIDTGAYHPRSGWLTGLDITSRQVFQANVFQNCTRTLSLEEATMPVEFTRMSSPCF
jgi:serine/threonine protein phosphatase 1